MIEKTLQLNSLNVCSVSVISEEADRLSELQAIEKELEELQPKEDQDQGQSSDISNNDQFSAQTSHMSP